MMTILVRRYIGQSILKRVVLASGHVKWDIGSSCLCSLFYSSHLFVVRLLDGGVHLLKAGVLLILDNQLCLVLFTHLNHGPVVGLFQLCQGRLLVLLQDHDVVLQLVWNKNKNGFKTDILSILREFFGGVETGSMYVQYVQGI